MVGGKIIEIRPEGEKSRLWVMDHRNGDECAVYIDTQPEMPQLGDDIWWQSRFAYWTPADHRFTDRPFWRVLAAFAAGFIILAGMVIGAYRWASDDLVRTTTRLEIRLDKQADQLQTINSTLSRVDQKLEDLTKPPAPLPRKP